MAKAMLSPGPIDAYVAQLEPDLFGRRRTRRRIAEEVRGHLEDAVERGIDDGLSLEQAQRAAIERFGSPTAVINGWAESKGIGVTTNLTRFGGLAGIIGALGLTASMVWAEMSWAFSIGWFAEVSLVFGAFLAVGMVALYLRVRGKLGRYGRVGFRLIVAGLIVGFGSSALWFVAGGVVAIAMLIAGASLYLVGALRADVLPRAPLLMWAAGFVVAVVVGLTGVISGLHTETVAAGVGYGLFNIGWIWLGSFLWSERPAVEHPETPAVA